VARFSTFLCCFNALLGYLVFATRGNCGYKCVVDESRSGRSLADDPSFPASLTNRESVRAKSDEFPREADNNPEFIAQPPVRRPTLAPARAAHAPPSAFGLELFPPAMLVPSAPAPTTEPGAPRAVVDRLPPLPDVRERPTAAPAPAAAPAVVELLPYETFYGLTEAPFSLSTDPKFLYHSTAHDRTAQALLTSIGKREGVVVITGPFGIGKTSLCRAVVEEIDRHTLTSFLVDPFLSVDDLLETLLIDFGVLSRDDLVPGSHPSTHQLRVTLKAFLGTLASLQASAVVLIDEAQNLPVSVLEELRTLAEIGDGQRLLHVVLVGDPELLSLLKRRDLRPLNEHVAVRSVLGPLAADELPGYVKHRLTVSGGLRVEFSDAALARIHELTEGVPRAINLLCYRAMARGYEASANVIDVALVDAAATDLELSAPVVVVKASPALRIMLAGVTFMLLMLVGAVGALWVFRDDVHRAVVQWQRVPPAPSAPEVPLTNPLHVPRQ
jgi:type II secretory pathway predicted ATPase ExeA